GKSRPKIGPKGVIDGQQDARCPYFFRLRRGREMPRANVRVPRATTLK
ncbi:hypothetical protein Godav_004654, partial [Gossypium davidsonii]|nr:hypothetical protein [Gossypium davidsonii]